MEEQILLGTLLGDAYIPKLIGRRKTYMIGWQHSKKQGEYAIWKAENSLSNYSVYERSRLDKRTGNIYHSITCYSTKDDYKYYRELFYRDKKEVSQEVLNRLTELSIAVWFMDDGSLYYNGNNCHLTLSVDSFNEDSKKRIINFFKDKYGIQFKNHQKRIRTTSVKQAELWDKHFSKYYHPTMMYKTLKDSKERYNKTLSNEKKKYRNKKYK